ncbi:Elongation factor G [Myxococcaceae bacterium]|jgi:elongation factor G|nr:Elongation factor G [Myxococcaceae bacterium]
MKDVPVRDTRSFALIGHAGDGKTSLGEALLHRAGAIPTLGRVDQGTSHLSYLPEEKERHHTLTSSVYAFDWAGKHLTLVDTPGDPNFLPDAEITVPALDGAVLVVSGIDGAKVGTERMWRHAGGNGIPTLAFVNALDKERSDFGAAVESLRKIGAKPVLLALPIGREAELRGVIDLLAMRASGPQGDGPLPNELAEAAATERERLVESVAECDDGLLEKYLEEGALSDEEVLRALSKGVREHAILPVLCGSATGLVGVELLLRSAVELLPSPADRAPWPAEDLADGKEHPLAADPNGPFAAVVLKTVIDRYAGTLSVLRIVSGTARPDMTVLDATTGSRERIGKLFVLHGGEHVEVPEAEPGDVIAVAKLKDVHTGNVLTAEKGGVHLHELSIPKGVISYAIQPKAKADEDKVHTSLGRLVEEDPTLHLGRDAGTGEFLLTGMGELHIRTAVQKLKRMFDVEVELKTPKVPYRETLTRRVENVEGKLKKQTGGKGMYAVCYVSVEPLPRGTGFEFVDEIVGGSIPRNLIPAVEKGVNEALLHGTLTGNPVVDVRVRCIDGKHHPVDSNEMAFKLAGSYAFKAAFEQAKPTLLEPIMTVEIVVPDTRVGDVMGDLSSRRGRVQASEARGASQVIRAQVPMAEMLEYASVLTSLTAGKGSFHLEFSHYDEVPAALREKIVAQSKASVGHPS